MIAYENIYKYQFFFFYTLQEATFYIHSISSYRKHNLFHFYDSSCIITKETSKYQLLLKSYE